MKSYKNENGITFIGFLLACAIVGFFAFLIMRFIPIYNETLKVDNAMETIAARSDVSTLGGKQLAKKLLRHFEIEDVDQFSKTNIMKYFSVKKIKGKDQRLMSMTYEIRRQLYADFDIVRNYEKKIIIDGTGN